MDKFVYGGTDTCWIFVSDSDDSVQENVRHMYDIIYAIDVLKSKGVHDSCIKVFTNYTLLDLKLFGHPEALGLSTIQDVLNSTHFEKAMVVVTGHGSHLGIAGGNLSPFGLTNAVRSINGIKSGTIVLCQCYAGVFNFLDAAKPKPDLALVGATNLNISLSVGINHELKQIDETVASEGWVANLFMYYFFTWIKNPEDIDGDGEKSLCDAFKYSGINTGRHISSNKSLLFIKANELNNQFSSLLAAVKLFNNEPSTPEEFDTYTKFLDVCTKLEENTSLLHLNQEPWLLHATKSRHILFE